jgi:hypothetical protein
VLKGRLAEAEAAGPVAAEATEPSQSEEDSAERGASEEPLAEESEAGVSDAVPRVTAAEAVRKLAELQVTCGYLLGMVRRRNPEVEQLLERVKEEAWIDCPGGINAQEKKPSPRTRVQ